MELKQILKLTAEKYPPTNERFLGAMLVLYDDGGGRIRGAGTGNTDLYSDRLFEFDNLKQLIQHLQEK